MPVMVVEKIKQYSTNLLSSSRGKNSCWLVLVLATGFMYVLSSCSNTRYLQNGQKLYTGSKLEIEKSPEITANETKDLKEQMEELLRPVPNSSFLGMRIKLYIYNKTKTDKTTGIKHWLNQKFGEPPVLVSDVNLAKNSEVLQGYLQNNSYFQAVVNGSLDTTAKKGSALYNILAGPSYHIASVSFPKGKDSLRSTINKATRRSILRKGKKYNLDDIKNERVRIDNRLKNKGFYFFAPENLLVKVDSTVGKHQVDMDMIVKPETPDRARKIYTIDSIFIYPGYSLRDTGRHKSIMEHYGWYNVVDPHHTIKPYAFKNTVLLHPGDTYSRQLHNNSINRMINLGPYKFVKNKFVQHEEDSAKLDVYYYLTPYKGKSLQLELQGRTTSANFMGSQININWKNRNAFKGAEAFTIGLFGSTDLQMGGSTKGNNVYQGGIKTGITWPRFISPFNFKSDNAYIPHTNLNLGYSINRRVKLYTLNSFTGSFGYEWRENAKRSHQLNLLNITYVNPTGVSAAYADSVKHSQNPTLAHVIDKQFTFGPSYSYTVTNTAQSYKRNTYYYNAAIDLSANLYGIISGANANKGHIKELFGQPFNQYVKIENEFRYFRRISRKSKLAARLMAGVGIPYGNSTILPYSKQFFIGGSNSLRGFRARSLGPGTYNVADAYAGSDFFPDQSGDIKIEGTVEYRPHIFGFMEGAVFTDFGNIWLFNANDGQPGGVFNGQFLNQMAADVGVGLRFDLTVLILRLDLGMPIRKPWLPKGDRWVFDQIDFGSNSWRKDNLIFNIAIGYPF